MLNIWKNNHKIELNISFVVYKMWPYIIFKYSPTNMIMYKVSFSVWENPMDRGAWQATVHGVTKRHDSVHAYGRSLKVFHMIWSTSKSLENLQRTSSPGLPGDNYSSVRY